MLVVRRTFVAMSLFATWLGGCRAGDPGAASDPTGLGRGYGSPADASAAAAPRTPDASAAYATNDAAPAAPDGGRGPAHPPYVVPTREPLPAAELVLRPGDPMPKKALPVGKRLGRGGVVPPGIPSPDRVAIAADHKGTLVEARTAKVLLALPTEPRYVSPRAGVVILEGKPRLVRLYDNTLITPAIEARGRQVKASWLAATDAHPRAVALAETDAGEKLAGLASDDLAKFDVAEVPLDPANEAYAATLNAIDWQLSARPRKGFGDAHGTPFSFPHGASCLRVKLADDGTTTCIEYEPRAGMLGVSWTEDGWFVGEAFVSHVSFGAKKIGWDDPRTPGSMCMTRASRAAPPRAIATCFRSPEAIVWAPERLLTFKGPADSNDIGGLVGADAGPVLPIVDDKPPRPDDWLARASTRWLDLVGLRLLTSPKLRPLPIAAFAGMESLALAEDRQDKTSDVYALDFEHATRELVARITDCPGVLGELREEGARGRRKWLVLACLTPPPAHSVAQSLIWSEIVDVERRTRWRTPLLPEIFFPDGVVVLSSRRQLSAESKTAAGELFAVDLAAP